MARKQSGLGKNFYDIFEDNMLESKKGTGENLRIAKLPLDLVFTAILCFCIRGIAKETGESKIVYKSIRNFVFYCVFFVLQSVILVASWTNLASLTWFVTTTALPYWTLLIELVCLIFNCLMIFSCYSRICDESDVDMPIKPSRFKKKRQELENEDTLDENTTDEK